jgi:hypothetical protein
VAASREAVLYFHDAIASGATQFEYKDSSQTIEFKSCQGFVVNLELLQFGGGFVDSIAVSEPFYDGFLASRTDLLVLRGVTVVGRGEDGDWLDFRYLVEATVKGGSILPQLDRDAVVVLKEVAGGLLWWEALVLSGIFMEDNFVLFTSL